MKLNWPDVESIDKFRFTLKSNQKQQKPAFGVDFENHYQFQNT